MKIFFTSPVRHDGKDYDVNDSADLDKAQATSLIEAGAATTQKPAKEVAPEAPQEGAKEE